MTLTLVFADSPAKAALEKLRDPLSKGAFVVAFITSGAAPWTSNFNEEIAPVSSQYPTLNPPSIEQLIWSTSAALTEG